MDLYYNYKLRKLNEKQIECYNNIDQKASKYWKRKIKPSIIHHKDNIYFVLC